MSDAATIGRVPQFQRHHRLRLALEWAGMKVSEMGEYLEVSPATMTNYLAGKKVPRPVVVAWALRTGVPFEWLDTGMEPISPPPSGPRGPSDDGKNPSARVVAINPRNRLPKAA